MKLAPITTARFAVAARAMIARQSASVFSGNPDVLATLLAARGARSVPLPMPKRWPPWAQIKYAEGSVTNWTSDEPA